MSFLDDHPGGADLILEYEGRDVTEIMRDESSHTHSDAAYEILQENLVGFLAKDAATGQAARVDIAIREHEGRGDIVTLPLANAMEGVSDDKKSSDRIEGINSATGLSSVKDLTTGENELKDDFATYRFLDLRRPLLGQVWSGGFTKDFYLEQVHRPRYYAGGGSAPLLGNALEPLSKMAWWMVPVIYLPSIIWGTFVAARGMPSPVRTAIYWLGGLSSWPFVEYIIHRSVCHMDRLVVPHKAQNAYFLFSQRLGKSIGIFPIIESL